MQTNLIGILYSNRRKYGRQLFLIAVILFLTLAINRGTTNTYAQSSYYVILDPGHGGTDPGAPRSDVAQNCGIPADLREKDVTLDIAQRVKNILEQNLVQVSMTRDNDVDVSLPARTNFINQELPNLVVSIHANSAESCGDGVEAWYSSVGPGGQPNPHLATSRELAQRLAASINDSLGLRLRRNNGIEDAAGSFHMVREPQVPAALVEMAFISNPTEALLMRDQPKAFAQAIADAILDQLGVSTGQGNSATVANISDPDSYSCSQSGYVTFEGLPEGTNLSSGTISGVQFSTTSGYSWLVGDFTTGNYNGKYPNGAYTSHGTHWTWLGVTQSAGRIDFPRGPASYISLLVSNLYPVYLDAYDTSGNLLATAGPSTSNTGTGHMTELKITRAIADIAYVMVHDQGNFFLIDDVCTDAPGTPDTINRIVDESYFMQTGERVSGNFFIKFVTGIQKYLHILLGPYFSDVDLILTRPDGTIVSSSDPGVTIVETANSIEITIDSALAGDWSYEIIANELEPGGENLHFVVDEETIVVEESQLYLPFILK